MAHSTGSHTQYTSYKTANVEIIHHMILLLRSKNGWTLVIQIYIIAYNESLISKHSAVVTQTLCFPNTSQHSYLSPSIPQACPIIPCTLPRSHPNQYHNIHVIRSSYKTNVSILSKKFEEEQHCVS